ncbi:helix-turn-helix transcriptional regulator [Nocardioides sp. NPDC006273]|uniref:helix-turn-helix domain-containing protein n=1 Tax=Nocardioides sp. NPDC006273 TaxID=3155598 RepID=UPI0033BB9C3F
MARRVAGLSQAELAERAGTSQATLSAYERGAKSPALKVAERILHVTGLELSVRTHVDFKERTVPGVEPFWVPNMLWNVGPPTCFVILHVPDMVNHTRQTHWDLSDRTDRARAYEILIRWGLPHSMLRWLDGALLIDLWDELNLPEEIRTCWTPAIAQATPAKTVDIFDFDFSRVLGPESTGNAQIRGYEPLPPQSPETPSRRERRVDPVNGRPWG